MQHRVGVQNGRYTILGVKTLRFIDVSFGGEGGLPGVAETGFRIGFSFYCPLPYYEALASSGIGIQTTNISFEDKSTVKIRILNRTEFHDLYENYTQMKWDFTSATLMANVSVTNTYDRTIRLEQIMFSITVSDGSKSETMRSQLWSLSNLVLGLGESQWFTVAFTITDEAWIKDVLDNTLQLDIDHTFFEYSVWSDMEGWIDFDVMKEDVTSRCVQVTVQASPSSCVKEWVTAHVDKLDGINILDVFDRLFLDYTDRYWSSHRTDGGQIGN